MCTTNNLLSFVLRLVVFVWDDADSHFVNFSLQTKNKLCPKRLGTLSSDTAAYMAQRNIFLILLEKERKRIKLELELFCSLDHLRQVTGAGERLKKRHKSDGVNIKPEGIIDLLNLGLV